MDRRPEPHEVGDQPGHDSYRSCSKGAVEVPAFSGRHGQGIAGALTAG
jgi:hypothetical protein